MWDAEQIDELAEANQMIVVRDPWSEFELLDPPAGDIIYTATHPRGRRTFDRDDMAEFIEYLEEHEGHVTVLFRGAERKRNAFAFGVELQRTREESSLVLHFEDEEDED